jgi:hypothetical protein
VEQIIAGRRALDQAIWADEVEAKRYERVFIDLWDCIRTANDAGKFAALAEFPLAEAISIGNAASCCQL